MGSFAGGFSKAMKMLTGEEDEEEIKKPTTKTEIEFTTDDNLTESFLK